MKVLIRPSLEEATALLQRPTEAVARSVFETVESVFTAVRKDGDGALIELTKRFDNYSLNDFSPSREERSLAISELPAELKKAIHIAEKNILTFHSAQRRDPLSVETAPGIVCERRALPIERVGLYIPGGTAPLFSTLLMLAIPAKLAGCKEIVLVSPPPIHPVILATADMLEISEIYQVGGAQAIAALALGTPSIKKVDKIFGPGNQYVTIAKQLVSQSGVTAIDMPAGPSELLVIADREANPDFVAADLLSQAEHGVDSQVVLITDCESNLLKIERALEKQLLELPRKEIAKQSLESSVAIVTETLEAAFDLSNFYAPEHLILATKEAERQKDLVKNAGSVFLGNYTPESLGDYASGTNHTLPTGGAARAYSGVSLESFQKQITFQRATKEGLEGIAETVEVMASAEGLDAHKRAVSIRRVAI